MRKFFPLLMKLAVAVLLAHVASTALAQPRREGREHERFRSPHWVFDDRFHHDHYYPAAGYAVTVLPAGNIAVTFRGGRLYYHAGVWFRPNGPGFVVVRPPVGIIVPVLPPAYTTVWVSGVPYYYANDLYYVTAPGGYAVAQPPSVPVAAPVQAAPPPPAASAPPVSQAGPSAGAAPGVWYYCESAKAYYPYVNACAEGWRSVPATPPR